MHVMEAIAQRRSVRSYQARPIEREKLAQIAQAFRLSPSARNEQGWKLFIVTDPAALQALHGAATGSPPWLKDAPAMLVACGLSKRVMTCGQRVDSVDLSIGMAYAILEAWELGLGTCWMASFREPDVRAALNLPQEMSVVAISPLGYPKEIPNPKPRKPVDEVVTYL